MQRDKYGNRNNNFGWKIDHIVPESKGGGNDISDLQPLQWEDNLAKSDNRNGGDFCVVRFTPKANEQA
jgi:5-methylcytosine-specific restriction endonuclease McrA